MGFSFHVYINDKEIARKADEEENLSALVVKLLRQHYGQTDLDKLSVEQIDKLIKIEEIKEEANKKAEEVLNASI